MEVEIAAWLKEKNGKKYFSGTIKEPDFERSMADSNRQAQQASYEDDEDVPF